MKRVLLTGATGFIGRHAIIPLVEKGYEVHAVSSRQSGNTLPNVQWYRSNLLDPKETTQLLAEIRPTHLLHFAWYAEHGKFWNSSQNFHWLEASINLMRHFKEQGGKRIVIAGTCAEYDLTYGYCSELVTPCRPATPYGVCKNALQETFTAFCMEEGISGAWGRIFYLYGPGENPKRLVACAINSLLRHEKARCTHGKQIRDFLHVYDVASAFVALLDSPVEGPINISSGQPVTIHEVVSLTAKFLESPGNVDFGALTSPANDPPLIVGDNRKLYNEIGWHPSYELTDGIAHTILYWQKRK